MKKGEIIMLHLKGESFRSIERQTGINRKTISRICESYDLNQEMLDRGNLSIEEKDVIIRSIVEAKPYNKENRNPRKMTDEIKNIEYNLSSAHLMDGERIFYHNIFGHSPKDLKESIIRMVPKINFDKINEIINCIDVMSDIRKEYLIKAISLTYKEMYEVALK